jgi:DNA uptake protein ComE-like DNA-binding protein
VNSRDIAQIRGLVGFGAKKAKDLVDYMELIGAEDGGQIESLAQLRTIPGLGGRAIERAYGGLMV